MKFFTPDGSPAAWTPVQERLRAWRLLTDDQRRAELNRAKVAGLRERLKDGATGSEIATWLVERTVMTRSREIGISLDVPLGFTKRGAPIMPIAGAIERLFSIQNSAQATTAAPVHQPTGTAIRTMQQIQCGTTLDLEIVEWGCSFDGTTSTNAPGEVELFTTTVAATMSTAAVSGDVTLFSNFGGTGTQIVFGATTNTGFATAAVTEGTVANYRLGDLQHIPPTSGYIKQWPLGREFQIPNGKYLRNRVTFANTVNEYFYCIWGEN
jgi:hypothetical protein